MRRVAVLLGLVIPVGCGDSGTGPDFEVVLESLSVSTQVIEGVILDVPVQWLRCQMQIGIHATGGKANDHAVSHHLCRGLARDLLFLHVGIWRSHQNDLPPQSAQFAAQFAQSATSLLTVVKTGPLTSILWL